MSSEAAPVLPDTGPIAPAPAAPPVEGAAAAPGAPVAAQAPAHAGAPAQAPAHAQYHPAGAAVVWYAGAENAASGGGGDMEGRVAAVEAELGALARENALRDDDLRNRVAAALALASSTSRDSAALCSALHDLERLLHPAARPPPPTSLPAAARPEPSHTPVQNQHPTGLWFPPPPTTPHVAQSPARYFSEVAEAGSYFEADRPGWGQPPHPHPHAFPPPSWQPPQPSWLPWREAGPPNHHDDKVDSDQWQGVQFQGGTGGQGPAPSVHLRMWLDRVTSETPFGERAGAARA